MHGFLPNVTNEKMPVAPDAGDGYAIFKYEDGEDKPTLELNASSNGADKVVGEDNNGGNGNGG